MHACRVCGDVSCGVSSSHRILLSTDADGVLEIVDVGQCVDICRAWVSGFGDFQVRMMPHAHTCTHLHIMYVYAHAYLYMC